MPETELTALEISEDILTRTGLGLKLGDFEVFAACFAIPHNIETFEGSCVVTNMADMRKVFDGMREQYHLAGVTELVRQCVTARFTAPDRIEMVHRSHQMSGTDILQCPYPVYSIVRRIDGAWKVTHGKYAMADAPEQSRILAGQKVRAYLEES